MFGWPAIIGARLRAQKMRGAWWSLLLCASYSRGAIIASSSLEACVNDGSHQPFQCSQKMVVALSVENGQDGTEVVEATLRDVVDRTGSLGPSSVPRELEEPIALTLSKTQVVVRYPVTYVQDINAAPREVVVHHDLNGCVDGNMATNPSCGWVIAPDGSQVTHSQGFCCSCSFDQTLGLSDQGTRASSLACDLFGNMQSAHCLRMDPLWYSAYEIGAPELHFTITVTSGNGSVALELGPHAPTALSPDGRVAARLVGDFATYVSDLELSGKMLLVPSVPANDPRVQAGVDAWMFVGKEEIELRGDRCNSPGVSYEAFRNQAKPCEQPMGSCLGGQIDEYYQDDLQRAASGDPTRYLVTGFGNFESYAHGATQYVAYTVDRMQASLVTLMIDAASIRFVTAASVGEIVRVEAPDFEAQSGGGELLVKVENTGLIKADFTVELACSSLVSQQPAQARTLSPAAPESVSFDLRVQSQHGGDHSCTVLLKGALFELLDNKTISFRATERETTQGAQGGEPQQTGKSEERLNLEFDNPFEDPCEVFCTSFFDLMCFVTFGCTMKLVRVLLLVFLPLLLCCCCGCALRSQSYRNCLSRLCCGICGGGRAADRSQQQQWQPPPQQQQQWQQQQWQQQQWRQQQPPQQWPQQQPPAKCNKRPPEQHLQYADPYLDPEGGYRKSDNSAPPLHGRRVSLDQRLQQQSNPQRTFVPSQGRRQSLDRKIELTPNDYIQRHPLEHSGLDTRNPPSNQPRSRAEEGTGTPHSTSCKDGTASQQSRDSKQQAYLNLDPECANALSSQTRLTGLLSPGPQFSLRGRIIQQRFQGGTRAQFILAPEDALQYLTWRNERTQLEPLQPPTRINRGFFQATSNRGYFQDSAEKAVDVSSVPKFPCINTPSLVEGNLEIPPFKTCQWKGEGPGGTGFDLRTSRDC